MITKENNKYNIVCDCCGDKISEVDTDIQENVEVMLSLQGWEAFEDGKHYCPRCYDWTDDDCIITNNGIKYNDEGYPVE